MSDALLGDRVVPIECGLPGQPPFVFAYYIDAPHAALVDAGVASSPGSSITEALARIGKRLADVRYVVNTHGHWDHLGGDAAVKDAGAKVAIHAADAGLARSREAHLAGYWGERLRLAGKPIESGRAHLIEHIAGEFEPDRLLADGDVVDLGGDVRLTIAHTPGHSAGSVTILLERDGLAFTGDAVQGGGSLGGRCPFYIDPVAYRASLWRLRSLKPRTLVGGHRFKWSQVASVVTGDDVDRTLAVSLESEDALRSAAGMERGAARQFLRGYFGYGDTEPDALAITLAGYATR